MRNYCLSYTVTLSSVWLSTFLSEFADVAADVCGGSIAPPDPVGGGK